jgi:glutamate-1-semialdehyde 2,1-aminomutase
MQILPADEIARINRLGDRLAEGIEQVLDELGIVGQVTGMGSLHTIHLTDEPVRDYRSFATSHPDLIRLLHLGLLNRGIFTAKRGMFVTSTPMNDADIDTAVEAVAGALGDLRPYIAEEAGHLLR